MSRAKTKTETTTPPDLDLAPKWYLGFDCATKTFAFCLMSISLEYYEKHRARLWGMALRLVRGELSPAEKAELDRETKSLIAPVDGEVVDLFPGKPDKSIHTIERLVAMSDYVESRILPAVRKHVPGIEENPKILNVPVEFQMGPNAAARAIASSLITLFRKHNVYLVGPSLKNKVWFTEPGRYCYFIEKYKAAYSANKAHAKYNFAHLESTFDSKIPGTKTASLRGHIADAGMQIIGHVMFWDKTLDPTKAF